MDAAGVPGAEPRAGQVRVALAVLVAIAVGLGLWLNRGGDDSAPSAPASIRGIVSFSELRSIAGAGPNPIYWAGARPGTELELTRESDGSAFVRYLPAGAEAGDPRADFLTIGTYLVADAAASIRRLVGSHGAGVRTGSDGSLIAADPRKPSSVYIAKPGSEVEVEVFDPSPRRALSLALSGSVEPAG